MADGGGVRPVVRSGSCVHQTNHDLLRQALCKVLVDGARAGRGAADGIGSVPFRACAALYGLLLDHPIDQRGRCRSCRPGVVFGSRWRRCQVYRTANLCLHQLDEVLLLGLLANEYGLVHELELDEAPPATGVPGGRAAGTGQ